MASDTPAPSTTPQRSNELKIVSHSGLFYWWPVWAIGYLMALVTYFGGDMATTVPTNSVAIRAVLEKDITLKLNTDVMKAGEQLGPHEQQRVTLKGNEGIIVVPHKEETRDGNKVIVPQLTDRWLQMSASKNLGVIWCTVILLVICITNIPLRGLWSVIVIVIIISTVTILSAFGVWDRIVPVVGLLDIRINLGGYFFVSSVLLGIWLVTMLFFDQQIYMVFTPGQFRVRQEIGDAEEAHDTTGMTMFKQRSDLFRHWILGLGSGDLIVRTSGANPKEFHLNNVLFLGRKVKLIEEMLRSKPIVTGQMR